MGGNAWERHGLFRFGAFVAARVRRPPQYQNAKSALHCGRIKRIIQRCNNRTQERRTEARRGGRVRGLIPLAIVAFHLAASSSPTARVLKVPPHPPVVELVAYDVGDQQHSDDRERAADDRPHEVPSLLYVHNRTQLEYRPVVPAAARTVSLHQCRLTICHSSSWNLRAEACPSTSPIREPPTGVWRLSAARQSATISSNLEGKMPT